MSWIVDSEAGAGEMQDPGRRGRWMVRSGLVRSCDADKGVEENGKQVCEGMSFGKAGGRQGFSERESHNSGSKGLRRLLR